MLPKVRLRNSTPEPDGWFGQSWLRVPDETQIAHEAVAWTFGMTEQEYLPRIES